MLVGRLLGPPIGDHEPARSRTSRRRERRARAAPDQPTDLPRQAWAGVLKRTFKEYKADNLGDLAAALTYYGVLAIFPMLIVLVSLLGLLGHSVTQPLIKISGRLRPAQPSRSSPARSTTSKSNKSTAGSPVHRRARGALWSASSYVAAFMRASNVVWDVREGRPIWKTIPVRLAVTLMTLVLLTLIAVAVVFTGGLARQLGNVIGVGTQPSDLGYRQVARAAARRGRDPVDPLLRRRMSASQDFAGSPPVADRCRPVWYLASRRCSRFYVANFSSYNKTYGAIASVIVFLVWLWITNTVILLGAELNAEIERGRQIEGGLPPIGSRSCRCAHEPKDLICRKPTR